MLNLLEKYWKNYGVDKRTLKKYYLFNTLLNIAESFESRSIISEMNGTVSLSKWYGTLIQKYPANCKALFLQLSNFQG